MKGKKPRAYVKLEQEIINISDDDIQPVPLAINQVDVPMINVEAEPEFASETVSENSDITSNHSERLAVSEH